MMIKNKRLKIVLITILSLVVLLVSAFLVYASVFYRADTVAATMLQSPAVTRVEENLVIISPDQPGDTALIFYPGAKVEHIAYLPILQQISQRRYITCILVKMPFNMAIFDVNAADEVIAQFPEIKHWYIGGHSMGGAMASSYASINQDKVEGLILLGAYVYGDYPPDKSLTIYGTFNTSVADAMNYSDNIVVIEGGNHAQFGNYGKQAGDPDATISSEEQQNIAVIAIDEFIAKKGN